MCSAVIEKNSSPGHQGKIDPYRVMVVDDSAVVRGLMSRWLKAEPSITVVGSAGNGQVALTNIPRCSPEIVILDIEMPVMDGLTALPKILEAYPKIKVLIASTLTKRNAEISLRALDLGAADYISKPKSSQEVVTSLSFQEEIISKVINIAAAARRQSGGHIFRGKASLIDEKLAPIERNTKPIKIRPFTKNKPGILAIGSSTGGPQALLQLLKNLESTTIPIVITQHMPANFTHSLARHLSNASNFACKEAEEGDVLEPGKAYLAPGDYHMTVRAEGGQKIIALNQDPPENFCRPSVEPLFRSLVQVYGAGVFGVILTGMGRDGLDGSRMLVEAGGNLFAQDEKSSVVWGMPGAVSNAGLCSSICPLDQIGLRIKEKLTGMAL